MQSSVVHEAMHYVVKSKMIIDKFLIMFKLKGRGKNNFLGFCPQLGGTQESTTFNENFSVNITY